MNKNRIRYRQLDYTIDEFRAELGDWDIPIEVVDQLQLQLFFLIMA